MSKLRMTVYRGGLPMLGPILQQVTKRAWRSILWDLPLEQRKLGLENALFAAKSLYLVEDELGLIMIAWLSELSAGGNACALHILFTRQTANYEKAARRALNVAADECSSLLGYCPAPWQGIRKLGKSLGFVEIARLKKAIWLADHKRFVDGILLLWTKNES